MTAPAVVVGLMHLPDGRHLCCICFEAFELSGFSDAPEGGKMNVCTGCAPRATLVCG